MFTRTYSSTKINRYTMYEREREREREGGGIARRIARLQTDRVRDRDRENGEWGKFPKSTPDGTRGELRKP